MVSGIMSFWIDYKSNVQLADTHRKQELCHKPMVGSQSCLISMQHRLPQVLFFYLAVVLS